MTNVHNYTEAFFLFDTDGSGHLSKKELKEAARALGLESSEIDRLLQKVSAMSASEVETRAHSFDSGGEFSSAPLDLSHLGMLWAGGRKL